MKKTLKKILCLTLALMLITSAVGSPVAAQSETSAPAAVTFPGNLFHMAGELFYKIKCLFTGEEYVKISKADFSCQREGLTIRGYEFRPQGDNLPVVIISHAFMANKLTVAYYAKMLARMGYAAYCYDFCGGCVALGKSDGKTTEMSVLTEEKDLKAVVGYVSALEYVDKDSITLMGCSQGGFVSALTAADLDEKIKSLVLFYPALSIPDDARKGSMMFAEFDPENIPEIIDCGPMKLGRIYAADVVAMDTFEEIAPYNGDVLIVHGTKDNIVDISYSQTAAEVYGKRQGNGSVRLEIIEGGGHIFMGKADSVAKDILKEYLALS